MKGNKFPPSLSPSYCLFPSLCSEGQLFRTGLYFVFFIKALACFVFEVKVKTQEQVVWEEAGTGTMQSCICSVIFPGLRCFPPLIFGIWCSVPLQSQDLTSVCRVGRVTQDGQHVVLFRRQGYEGTPRNIKNYSFATLPKKLQSQS